MIGSLFGRRSIGQAIALFFLAALAAPAAAIEIQQVKSPGGIEAWLVRDTSVPILSIEFSFRGGRTYDPANKAGLSNLLSGMLDEGAGELDSKTFQTELQNKSIRMSFGAGRDTFRGSLKTLNVHRKRAAELLSLALTQPRLDAEPLERMRQQSLVSLKRRATNPNYIAGRTWATAVFGAHPMPCPRAARRKSECNYATGPARRRKGPICPEPTDHRGDRRYYTGGTWPSARPSLRTLPARGDMATIPEVEPEFRGETYVVDLDVPQSAILFGQRGLKRDDPHWYTGLVMNYILGGGGFSSRLYSEVREKRGLAYSVGAGLNPMRLTALIAGSAGTNNENVAESLKIIQSEWRRMRDEGVTEDELSQAKSFLTGSFPLRLSSTDRIARMLVSIQYHNLGIDYIDRRASYIKAVTRDDIAKLARELVDPEGLTFVIVGKPKAVKATAPAPQI